MNECGWRAVNLDYTIFWCTFTFYFKMINSDFAQMAPFIMNTYLVEGILKDLGSNEGKWVSRNVQRMKNLLGLLFA